MKTKQIYYQDSYKNILGAKVLSIEDKNNLSNIILDQTIFYPEGGGQPNDTGVIEGKEGNAKVEYVRLIDGEIIHQTKLAGKIKINDIVQMSLLWNDRYKNMRVHSAGHLLHDVLMTMIPNLIPLRGGHGKKPFLEYKGSVKVNQKEAIEQETNKVLQQDLPIVTREATYTEIKEECRFIPQNLPTNKTLRMIKIGNFPGMPDGGVHVKSTKEIGKIWIANIIEDREKTMIRYGVGGL